MQQEYTFELQLAEELRQRPDIHDWSIRAVSKQSRQLFTTNRRRDTGREVLEKQLVVRIYHDLLQKSGQPQLRGSAGFTLVPTPNLRVDARHMLDQALLMARAAGNPYYPLPLPPTGGYPSVQSCDETIVERSREALEELFTTIAATTSTETQLAASSAELFATSSTTHFLNSRGIAATAQSTSATLEIKLIASDGTRYAEHDLLTSRRRLSDIHIEEVIRRNARYARDSLKAQLPASHTGPVVISGEALVDLFSPLIYHTSAQTAYQSLSQLHIGEPLPTFASGQAPQSTGTALTLASSRTLPFGNETLPFDDEGIPAQDVTLIQDGILQRYWADQRHAYYLDIPVTGRFGNIVMATGKEPYHALVADEPTYEIVAFSWMTPDVQTGNFVAEIRLGYLHTHGEKLPIKGGSLRGNVLSAFSHFSASSETQFTGNFSGPLAIRFGDLTISGSG